MLNSILFHWIGAHILVKGNITITDAGAYAAARKADEKSKQVRFKKFLQFRNRMSETTQIDNVRDILWCQCTTFLFFYSWVFVHEYSQILWQ